MRKVFLDDLPKRGDNINWKKSIGCKLDFIYEDVKGSIMILDYDGKKLTIRYKDKEKKVLTDSLIRCQLGKFIGITTSRREDFKFKIGDVVTTKTSKLKIIKCYRAGKLNSKRYEYKCLTCGNVDNIFEGNIKKKQGCNVCCTPSKKILKGYNDLWTTHPEVASLLKHPEKGYKLSHGSHIRQDFVCPNCSNQIYNKQIPNIISYGLSCPKCSDKLSYPEKFMFNVLEQLNIEFEQQKIFNWLDGKRFDFYIREYNCIIETHGEQHYGKGFSNLKGKSLKEVNENDELKKRSAIDNGIENYIIIDCSRSEFDFVKNSVSNSDLNKLIDLGSIDWRKCHQYACGTLVKISSDLWNDGKKVEEIKEIMKINSNTTVIKYLKQASELGWCNYDSREVMKKVGRMKRDTTPKPVVRLSLDGEYIDEFKSRGQASRELSIYKCGIQQVCEGKRYQVKGFKFMYKEDFEKYIKENNEY